VAGAEVAAELAFRLALAGTERHAAQVGADAHGDQPVFLALLGAFLKRLRIAERGNVDLVGFRDLMWRQVAHEDRLLAEDRLDGLTGLDRGNVDLGRRRRKNVRRSGHLADQRDDDSHAGDTRRAYRGDIDEIAPPHAICFCHDCPCLVIDNLLPGFRKQAQIPDQFYFCLF